MLISIDNVETYRYEIIEIIKSLYDSPSSVGSSTFVPSSLQQHNCRLI